MPALRHGDHEPGTNAAEVRLRLPAAWVEGESGMATRNESRQGIRLIFWLLPSIPALKPAVLIDVNENLRRERHPPRDSGSVGWASVLRIIHRLYDKVN